MCNYCFTPFQCYRNSQALDDNVERFIRSHPLVNTPVNQEESEPLFHLQNVVYEKIAIDRVATPKETYTVFFLATGKFIRKVQCYLCKHGLISVH